MVENHSYKLSPLGPALQLGGGSSVISASSFWMRLAEVLSALLSCLLATDCLTGFAEDEEDVDEEEDEDEEVVASSLASGDSL